MRASKSMRVAGVVASAALVLGGLVIGPAEAAKKKPCKKYKPATPQSDSESRTEAKKGKVLKITDKRTKKKPLVIKYSHGPAFWFISDPIGGTPQGQRAAIEDTKWFKIQVDSKKKMVGLYIRQEWAETPVSDMDLYIWDKWGSAVARSADFNQAEGTPINAGTGGPGFEQVSGLGAKQCTGFTIESRAFTTPGEAMKLKVWLGPIK